MICTLLLVKGVGGSREYPDIDGLNTLTSQTLLSSTDRPQVSIRFNADGTIDQAEGDDSGPLSYSQTGTWLTGGFVPLDATDWECKMTIVTEDVTNANTFSGSGTTYAALNTAPLYTLQKDTNSAGDSSATVNFQLRNKTHNLFLDSSPTITFNVNVFDDT